MEHNELTSYLSGAIERLIKTIFKSAITNPKEAMFLMKAVRSNKKAHKIRTRFEQSGVHIPAFLICSITTSCNLFCKGCYARANHACGENLPSDVLTDERWEELFAQAGSLGVSFVLLAGGEPLLRRKVIESAARFPEIIFPVFTNGTVLDGDYLNLFDRSRNLFPVISIEGDEKTTDERRGEGTYRKIQDTFEKMKRTGVYFGASVTVTVQNLKEVTSQDYIADLSSAGCRVVLFVEYVPVNNTRHLAPADRERTYLADRLIELKNEFHSMLFLSFPGDEKFTGGCLAAGRGFFHISPYGNAEPCPFSPYSDMNLRTSGILDALQSPLFQKLKLAELVGGDHNGGCALFGKDEQVKGLCGTEKSGRGD